MDFIHLKKYAVLLFFNLFFSMNAWAGETLPSPESYFFSGIKAKKSLDDPTDLFVTRPFKSRLPPEIWEMMTFDKEEMKKKTIELMGFAAQELVGKIAPEIKPGKYSYKDLEQYPGLRKLFPPVYAQHFIKPGGPPLVANIPEFEIIPTRQFHLYIPLLEATEKNVGKTKQDKDGYVYQWPLEGGIPFPRPSGEHKAQQVMYNFDRRSLLFDKNWGESLESLGYDRNLKLDKLGAVDVAAIRYKSRTLFPPFGWYDERAEKNNEWMGYGYVISEPRANRGMVLLRYRYDDPDKLDPAMIYLPSMRRVRKMSSTDTQDPTGDMIYDDQNMFMQKITPKKYPYRYEIVEEREYLMGYSYGSMPTWMDSKSGYALRDVQFMRRPCYVLQMTQLDPNYAYGKRIYYIDKESFDCSYAEYYDQKGRLYRTQAHLSLSFLPDHGMISTYGSFVIQRDHIDMHSTFSQNTVLPAVWPRSRFSMQYLVKRGK